MVAGGAHLDVMWHSYLIWRTSGPHPYAMCHAQNECGSPNRGLILCCLRIRGGPGQIEVFIRPQRAQLGRNPILSTEFWEALWH